MGGTATTMAPPRCPPLCPWSSPWWRAPWRRLKARSELGLCTCFHRRLRPRALAKREAMLLPLRALLVGFFRGASEFTELLKDDLDESTRAVAVVAACTMNPVMLS